MSVHDDIFPSVRSPDYVQTEWAKGWAYSVIGFGEAARRLTADRSKMHASVDQIGLAIFYLQRHRIELVIKEALVALGEDEVAIAGLGHNLDRLWQKLKAVVMGVDPGHWHELAGEHGEFVAAIHKADAGSFSYRYPIDKTGEDSAREDFIDLDALERHAEKLEAGLGGYTGWISEGRREQG